MNASLQRWIYASVSLAAAAPIWIWPWAWMEAPQVMSWLLPVWQTGAAAMLAAAVTADTMLASQCDASPSRLLGHASWVLGALLWISLASRSHHAIWLLALAFFAHGMRSAHALWHARGYWWAWIAWVRDTGTALALCYWLWTWNHG